MAVRFSNSSWVSFGKLCFLQKCPRKHFLICLHQVYNIFLMFIFPFLKQLLQNWILNLNLCIYFVLGILSLSLSFFFFTVYIVYPMFSFQFGILLSFFHYFSLHRVTSSNLLSVWLLQATVLPWLCSYLGYY